ncbi:MAG: aminopeptidase P family protein [Tissierellia bacterium]|nr:aminopeptidase P family protein [Tissierellia bacterium]
MNSTEKIQKLREIMKREGMDYFVVPTSDPHMSEYVMERFKSRVYLTNFTGSAGYCIITNEKALLWADGRYHVQAAKEIKGTPFTLMKWGNEGVPTWEEWLKESYTKGQVVGFNGQIVPQSMFDRMKELLGPEAEFIIDKDPVGEFWEHRPEFPMGEAFILSEEFTGETPSERMEKVRSIMEQKSADKIFFSTLDDICYLLNLRGKDDGYTPIVVSYFLLGQNDATLYVDERKLDQTVQSYLQKYGVKIKAYEAVEEDLKALSKNQKVWVDSSRTSALHYAILKDRANLLVEGLPTTLQKAIKNQQEIENIKIAHIKDGAALTKFLFWMKKNIGKIPMDELNVAEKLHAYRAEVDTFLSESFPTISAYAANAAMAHYSATEEEFAEIEAKGLYLVDSGGQYQEGTTDVTRTIAMGEPTEEEIHDYTLVLKGHVDLVTAKFLKGTTGQVLDMLARNPMWREAIDFKHGTGHGVGFVLGVHEGPHSISTKNIQVPLVPGMVVSNEPGIYKENKHGIRIENLVFVEEFRQNEFGTFYGFEDFTYVPHERALIDKDLLTKEEIAYIDQYHRRTFELLQGYMNDEELEMLKEATKPL